MSYYKAEYERPQERGPKKATPEQIYLVHQWQRQAGKLQQREQRPCCKPLTAS